MSRRLLAMYGNIGKQQWASKGTHVFDHGAPTFEEAGLNHGDTTPHEFDLLSTRQKTSELHLVADPAAIQRFMHLSRVIGVPGVLDGASTHDIGPDAVLGEQRQCAKDREMI